MIHVWGPPEGPMPKDGAYCGELKMGVEVVFHVLPTWNGRKQEWRCERCKAKKRFPREIP